ncbi:MAG: hypothetical protein SH809_17385 [Rhodothermales bacterium]|nr:hypothetical protein [Rhodothermales bacterium]
MSLQHITRLDYQKTHGWWVRIRRKSNPCSKLFSDGVHGGKEEALAKAVAWRDEKLKDAPKLASRTVESGSKHVKTGVPGLSLTFVEGSEGPLAHLQVSIQRGGKRTGTRYSINKWGLRASLWKACVAIAKGTLPAANGSGRSSLQEMAVQLYDDSFPNISAALQDMNLVVEEPAEVEGEAK